MSIVVAWDDVEPSVVNLTFDREWTWDDLSDALRESQQLLQEIVGYGGLILIMPPQIRLPNQFLSNIAPFLHGTVRVRVHSVVVVTPDLLSDVMMRAVLRVYGNQFASYMLFTALTPEEARNYILRRANELGQ